MICKKCGRVTDNESDICKGCGAQLRRPKGYISEGISEALNNYLPFGKGRMKVWKAFIIPLLLIALMVSGLYAAPSVSEYIASRRNEASEPAKEETQPLLLSMVSGDIAVIDKPMFRVSDSDIMLPVSASDVVTSYSDCIMLENTAYSDGSWTREYLVYDDISVRMMRFADKGIEAFDRIRQLYPNIANIQYYSDSPFVSGFASTRIFIPATAERDTIVDALIVTTESNDYIITVEATEEVYDENEANVDEWMRRTIIIDALTGIEYGTEISESDAGVSSSDSGESEDDEEYYSIGDYSGD